MGSEVRRLLAKGFKVNSQTKNRSSLLHTAAAEGQIFLVQLLLRSGAEVDVTKFEALAQCSCAGQLDRAASVPARLHAGPRSRLQPRCFDPIDLAPFIRPEDYDDATRLRIARQWDDSFRTIGFAVIKGHGVPDELTQDLRTASKMFFSSTNDYKHRFSRGPVMTGRSGYAPLNSGLAGAVHSDPVEGYTFMRHSTSKWNDPTESHPEELNGIGPRYCNDIERVMHALHRVSAVALGLREDYFEPYYKDPASVVVISHYPPLVPQACSVKVPEGKLRYRAHSDYSGFTILLQDEDDFGPGGGCGLEVDVGGVWLPLRPQKGCFVVNIGDLFETWTNDRWRSTPHRVSSPSLRSAAASRSRLTVMLFSGPSLDSVIAPISTCVDAEHPARYEAVSAAEHLKGMYKSKSKERNYKPG